MVGRHTLQLKTADAEVFLMQVAGVQGERLPEGTDLQLLILTTEVLLLR